MVNAPNTEESMSTFCVDVCGVTPSTQPGEHRAQSHIRPVPTHAKFEISQLYLVSFMPETLHNHHVSYIKMCRLYISHNMHAP